MFTKLLLFCAVWCLVSCEIEDGISVLVSRGKSDCYYRDLKKGDRMDLEVQVLSGGDLHINILILSPTGRIILDEQSMTETSSEIKVDEDGAYKVCFDNVYSLYYDKVVYFDLGIDENNKTKVDHAELLENLALEKDEIENTQEIVQSLDRISIIFETIQDMQTKLRSRYSRHHYLQNSNMSLVQWFSGISCLLMVVVGGLQVFLVRNLFKENTPKGLRTGL